MGLFRPPNVEKMKAGRDVKGLVKALSYEKEGSVRAEAAKALGELGEARAVEPLVASLKDSVWYIRAEASKALGELGDARAVEPLIAALKDSDKNVRKEAAIALGQIGDARAVEPLIAALKDSDQEVRSSVLGALDRIGWQPAQDEIGAVYWIVQRKWDKCIEIGAAAVEPLIAALKDSDKNVRKEAVIALGQIGGAHAVEPLIVAGKDEDLDVHKAAYVALCKIGAPAVEPLTVTLRDGSWRVRPKAAEALGEIGDARAVEPLVAALKDNDNNVQKAAAYALSKIGSPAVEPLIAALKVENYYVRRVAVEVLGKIGTPAVEPLIAAFQDGDKAVAEALDKSGWKPGKDATGAMYWIAKRNFDKCIEIGAPAVPPLIIALKKESFPVLQEIVAALDKLGWQPDKDSVGAMYWIAKGNFNNCVEIGATAVEPLLAALKVQELHVREAAAEALGLIGTPAVEPLLAALKDRDEKVRSYAASALANLGWQPGNDENAAWYWIAKQKWFECQALGSLAVMPLVAFLVGSSKKDLANRAAAKTLVELYKSNLIESTQKKLILEQKNNIVSKHTDQKLHSDYVNESHTDVDCTGMHHGDSPSGSHNDKFSKHTDDGVSIEFPL